MFKDRRIAPRLTLNSPATIRLLGDPRPKDCKVIDLSASGVRIYAETPIPDVFTLASSSLTPRNCRVVWRLGHEIGAEFL